MIRKYYEYEGLGGGIDPKSTSKAQPMTQTMTKEQILGNYYREHKDTESAIYEAMDHYKDQEVAKEREKAKKLVEALKHIKFGIDVAASQNANYVIETADIELIKQSLTEYEL